MARKKDQGTKKGILTALFGTKYRPADQFLAELNLKHSVKVIGIGGEQALNDANTKQEVGISDFNGTLTPTDSVGFIDAVICRFGKSTETDAPASPAVVTFSEKKADFPSWLLNSELILKKQMVEQFRIRISELVLLGDPQIPAAEWAKELERAVKVEGGQDLQIYLSTPKGVTLDTTTIKHYYLSVDLYGVKFGDRKNA
jgi:hypothetical protein